MKNLGFWVNHLMQNMEEVCVPHTHTHTHTHLHLLTHAHTHTRVHLHMHTHTQIYESTRDDHFSLIVTDYASEDANVEELMRKSSFKK